MPYAAPQTLQTHTLTLHTPEVLAQLKTEVEKVPSKEALLIEVPFGSDLELGFQQGSSESDSILKRNC